MPAEEKQYCYKCIEKAHLIEILYHNNLIGVVNKEANIKQICQDHYNSIFFEMIGGKK